MSEQPAASAPAVEPQTAPVAAKPAPAPAEVAASAGPRRLRYAPDLAPRLELGEFPLIMLDGRARIVSDAAWHALGAMGALTVGMRPRPGRRRHEKVALRVRDMESDGHQVVVNELWLGSRVIALPGSLRQSAAQAGVPVVQPGDPRGIGRLLEAAQALSAAPMEPEPAAVSASVGEEVLGRPDQDGETIVLPDGRETRKIRLSGPAR